MGSQQRSKIKNQADFKTEDGFILNSDY